LIEKAQTEARTGISIWSAGCASGEEPYTLSIMWAMVFAANQPTLRLSKLATDADETMIGRAGSARYSSGSLKDLPESWTREAFFEANGGFVLRPEFRTTVEFKRQDIRCAMPEGPFDLVLCRNLVFTYFDDGLQRKMLTGILEKFRPGGLLVIGKHEQPPAVLPELVSCTPDLGVFRINAGVRAAAGVS
jgi:chemotaxis protein methyltransferase CheR